MPQYLFTDQALTHHHFRSGHVTPKWAMSCPQISQFAIRVHSPEMFKWRDNSRTNEEHAVASSNPGEPSETPQAPAQDPIATANAQPQEVAVASEVSAIAASADLQNTSTSDNVVMVSETGRFRQRGLSSSAESRVEGGGQLVKGSSATSSVESLRRLSQNHTAAKKSRVSDEKSDNSEKSAQQQSVNDDANRLTTSQSPAEPSQISDVAEKAADANEGRSEGAHPKTPQSDAQNDAQRDTPREAQSNSGNDAPSENNTNITPGHSRSASAEADSENSYRWSWKVPMPVAQKVSQTASWIAKRSSQWSTGEPAPSDSPLEQKEPQAQGETQESSNQSRPDFASKSKEGGGWAFWSRKSRSGDSSVDEGQLAISGTDTATRPQEATVREPEPKPKGKKDKDKSKRQKPSRPSLVVPSFDNSFEFQSQSARFMSSLSRLGVWHPSKCHRVPPVRVRKAVIIGIHGYFPARFTRAILGEPTGTSLKFANEAAKILEEWAVKQNQSISIEKIALEGEGKIQHRVDTLYRLILNWQDLIRSADFVFFAVHSQGMVVATHIISRLISDNLLQSQRLGLLGMAGVCLGPMPGMDQTLVMRAISTIEHDSLMELFQLQNPESSLAKQFSEAFSAILKHGTKVVLVGSADDQLVPLYSALAANIDHPNIFRAVYIDGDDLAPEVITPLLTLALKRRNSGQSDHGVIVEISNPLAGAITGKGHSKLYSSDAVYRSAVESFLETNLNKNLSAAVDHSFKIPRHNPYVLPWALHALIADSENNPQYSGLISALYEDIRLWRPESKPLKDLKYRLEALHKAARL